jgi:4-hydroxyphenylacetate 3-monooxygenase
MGGEHGDEVSAMPLRDGAAYLASLRDGRKVWIDGERVEDVTRHPVLGRGAGAMAALFDLQTSPEPGAAMTYPSSLSGAPVSLSYLEPRSVGDLARRREMFVRWAELSGGNLGRTPDYLRALVTGCAINAEYFARGGAEHGERIVAYYER